MTSSLGDANRLELATNIWDSEEDDTLVCRAVRQETHDVKTFVLTPATPGRFTYQPGQFMTYAFEIDGETIHRCYTISAAPTRPNAISLTVKRVPNGPVSNWLHDNLKPGVSVKALGPMGNFTCFAHPATRYLFLSGGSGITPMMSMARTFHDLADPKDIVFVHSARTVTDIIFREELELMARLNPSFKFAPICEAANPLAAYNGLTGRLSLEQLKLVAPDFMDREIFCCGPTPYMSAIKHLLQGNGYDMSRYHEEAFGPTPPEIRAEVKELAAEAAEAPEVPLADLHQVEFVSTGKSIRVAPGETVHAAAAKLGLHIPKACGMGICGTCKVMKTAGEVDMEHNGGITDEDVAEGYILSCCSVPKGDVAIDY